MADENRKRSRFDQVEVEPSRKSRFDRRSRSPTRDDTEQPRTRSPVAKDEKPKKDPAAAIAAARAAAANAAAKINAQLSMMPRSQLAETGPVRAVASPVTSQANEKEEVYQQDGDFIKDIEVNDLRNRYTLTKGSTQKQIKDETGADVTTRGSYYPDKSMATAAAPPLYLHVTSTTKEGLDAAVAKIEELMSQDLPELIDQRRLRKGKDDFERDAQGRRKWPEVSIPIDLEPIPGFNLRATVVGSGGSNVKHIQQETRSRVQIKGRGSGYMEHDTGLESDEAMYLHVAAPEQALVDSAKELCISLVESVKQRYEEFKESRVSGGGRDNYNNGGFNDRGPRERQSGGASAYGGNNQQYGNQQYGGGSSYAANTGYGSAYGGAQSPVDVSGQGGQAAQSEAPMDAAQYQAWASYYAANPSLDPYIQYGGFTAYMQAYMQSYAQQYSGHDGTVDQTNGYAAADGQASTPGTQIPPPPGL